MTTEPTELIGTHKGRPTMQTPHGVLFADTEAFSRYTETARIRDWLTAFLDDMEHLRIDAPAAVKRIDDFWTTLQPCHASLKEHQLLRIRACLAGGSAVHLGQQLTGLRVETHNHWGYGVRNIAQDCESVPTGQEIAYSGPFPREPHDGSMVYGYHRGSPHCVRR